MNDSKILELYWNRDEKAIFETEKKYGQYCYSIANNILKNKEDSNECVNDTYLKTWNAIPPHKPNVLKLFLGKIVRNLAINKYEKVRAQKRNSELEYILEELEECLPSKENTEESVEYNELTNYLNEFLQTLTMEKRKIFLFRYWYALPIKEIAKENKQNENNIKVILHRTRKELKDYLTEREVVI